MRSYHYYHKILISFSPMNFWANTQIGIRVDNPKPCSTLRVVEGWGQLPTNCAWTTQKVGIHFICLDLTSSRWIISHCSNLIPYKQLIGIVALFSDKARPMRFRNLPPWVSWHCAGRNILKASRQRKPWQSQGKHRETTQLTLQSNYEMPKNISEKGPPKIAFGASCSRWASDGLSTDDVDTQTQSKVAVDVPQALIEHCATPLWMIV